MHTGQASTHGSASTAFFRAVEKRLEGQRIAADTEAYRTTAATLHVLMERLSGGEAQRVAHNLPELAPLLADGDLDRAAARFGFDEFLARVMRESGATEDAAHRITQAVFAELRERLDPSVLRGIASQLPSDIFVVWNTPTRGRSSEEYAGREPAPPRPDLPDELELSHPVLERIASEIELPEGVSAGAALVVTLCPLLLALPASRAAETRDALPAPLRDLLARCTSERDEEPTSFGASDLLETIGAELGVDRRRAEHIARTIFAALEPALPEGALEALRAQLQPELAELTTAERDR